MITFLGIVAAIAFVISGAPLARTVFLAPKLVGFSRAGWSALFVAVSVILVQLILLGASPIVIGAQIFNTAIVGFVTVHVFRKGSS